MIDGTDSTQRAAMESKSKTPIEVPSSPSLDVLQSPYGEVPYQQPSNFVTVASGHFNAAVDGRHTDLIVLATCFTTGLIDTVMFNAYGTFVSMQTGNTIFIALGASDQSTKPDSWACSLLSIGCYSLGAFFFARLNATFLPPAKRRGTLMASFLIQAVLIFISVAVVQAGYVDGAIPAYAYTDVAPRYQLIPIALLSFQSAGQIVNSRAMNINEVPTVVITSLLCDLFSDASLLAPLGANIKRNRRVAGFLLLLLGAIMSGWVSRSTHRVEPVLWIAGGLKAAMFLAWTFWPWMQSKEESVANAGRV